MSMSKSKLSDYLDKIERHRTLFSLLNYGIKIAAPFLLLPVIEKGYGSEGVHTWLIFTSVWSFTQVMDAGALQYFARLFGGVNTNHQRFFGNTLATPLGADDVLTFEQHFSRVHNIYAILVSVICFGMMYKYTTDQQHSSELPFAVLALSAGVSVACFFYLRGNFYIGVCLGLNRYASSQILLLSFGLMSVIVVLCLTIFEIALFGLIISFLLPLILQSFVFRIIARRITARRFRAGLHLSSAIHKMFQKRAYSDIAKSAIGILASQGLLIQLSLHLANSGNATEGASILFCFQAFRATIAVTQIPFYSSIPHFADLHAQDEMSLLSTTVIKKFYISVLLFLIGSFCFLIVFNYTTFALELFSVSSFQNISFGLFFLFICERISSMLLQVMTIHGRVRWHIVNSAGGLCVLAIYIWLFESVTANSFLVLVGLIYLLVNIPIMLCFSDNRALISSLLREIEYKR